VLQGQGIGGGMGIDGPVPPRLGREGDHQLNGIPLMLGSRPRSMTDPQALCTAGPRQTRRHHWRSQRQSQLTTCGDGCNPAGRGSQ
jgi:hypothetical protein